MCNEKPCPQKYSINQNLNYFAFTSNKTSMSTFLTRTNKETSTSIHDFTIDTECNEWNEPLTGDKGQYWAQCGITDSSHQRPLCSLPSADWLGNGNHMPDSSSDWWFKYQLINGSIGSRAPLWEVSWEIKALDIISIDLLCVNMPSPEGSTDVFMPSQHLSGVMCAESS